MNKNVLITFVVPCFNEGGNISGLYSRISEVFAGYCFDVVFVDDGSRDDSLSVIRKLVKDNDNVLGISFSRNFGKEAAILAGLHKADGKYTCLIDADLQQDPEHVLRMVEIMEKDDSIDCVCAVPAKRVESRILNYIKERFYKVINSLSSVPLEENASDFRTFRTNVRDSLISLEENNRFSKGLFSWVGYKTVAIEYDVKPRLTGETSWSFRSLLNYAISGIVSFSTKPLKYPMITGVVFAIITFVFMIVELIRSFTGSVLTITDFVIFLILFVTSVQLAMLGIVAYYVADIHIQTKHRPIYITKEQIDNE